jgi:hypothetical protein
MRKYGLFGVIILVLLMAVTSLPVLGELREDIISFNPRIAQVANVNGRWKVISDNKLLLDFGLNQEQANQALQVISFYRLNQQCFVGRPKASMTYYLVNGKAPIGSMPGEDSIYFDNTKLKVVYINNHWKIIETPSHAMLDFGQNEAEAWTALRIIWKYDFSYICFVGRPNPPMIYFRR